MIQKIFFVSPHNEGIPYGPRIYIPAITLEEWFKLIEDNAEFSYEWVRTVLASFSAWGGNTSSDSESYWMFEFPSSSPSKLKDAISFLIAHGWAKVSDMDIVLGRKKSA